MSSIYPTGMLESWKPASYFRNLAKRSNVAIERIITISRADGCAQYHVIEFQSSGDLINAQLARLLERDILSLNLRMPLAEALHHPSVMESAIDSALAERRKMELRRLRQRNNIKQQRSKLDAKPRPQHAHHVVDVGADDRVSSRVVTSFGCASASECAMLRQAKAHMAAAAAAAAASAFHRASPSGQRKIDCGRHSPEQRATYGSPVANCA
jgi:hypothetical protein